jgi:osmotically-inducible protein OsmY
MRILGITSYLLLISLLLQACAPMIIAGAAVGVTLANDRRSPATIIDDQEIESGLQRSLSDDSVLANGTHISATSFNHIVLLTGQAQDQQQRNRAAELAKNTTGTRRVHNEILIATPTPIKTRNQDAWLTTKVKNALLHHASLNAMQIKVVTENSTVYLMGLVSQAEGHAAATTAQQVGGVSGVIKVFDYLD